MPFPVLCMKATQRQIAKLEVIDSLFLAAQSLRCGFGKLEVIDFFVRYI